MENKNTCQPLTVKFIDAVAQNMPTMSVDAMQEWIDNPKKLRKDLQEIFFPQGTVLPAKIKKFEPEKYFSLKRGKVWISYDFGNMIVSRAKQIRLMPETLVVFHDFKQPIDDFGIKAQFIENYTFDGVYDFVPFLARLIDRQLYGKSGDLLSNGDENIFRVHFYSKVFTVCVRRPFPDSSEWHCFAYSFNPEGFTTPNSRVFLSI